jgi:hypothetical protein
MCAHLLHFEVIQRKLHEVTGIFGTPTAVTWLFTLILNANGFLLFYFHPAVNLWFSIFPLFCILFFCIVCWAGIWFKKIFGVIFSMTHVLDRSVVNEHSWLTEILFLIHWQWTTCPVWETCIWAGGSLGIIGRMMLCVTDTPSIIKLIFLPASCYSAHY